MEVKSNGTYRKRGRQSWKDICVYAYTLLIVIYSEGKVFRDLQKKEDRVGKINMFMNIHCSK